MEKPSFFKFWGKAEKNGQSWHPAVCHMIDTGIVAQEILSLQPEPFRKIFTAPFQLNETDALNAISLITSLHDIGKISPGFQKKRADLCDRIESEGFLFPHGAEQKHGRVALVSLTDIFENIFKCGPEETDALSRILAAHHGVFDEARDVIIGESPWVDARRDTAVFLAEVFHVTSLEFLRFGCLSTLFLVAGLVSVADWIASDEKIFQYINSPVVDMDTYMHERRSTTRRLLSKLSMGKQVDCEKTFTDLFDFGSPNACQQATLDLIDELSHPMLVVVETPMGSGKTEAAQAAYARLSARDGLRGMYCALPTQATGNAMLPRMKKFLSRLHNQETAELHLLHANAGMHEEYDKLKISAGNDSGETVVASSWFAQRKRGLLASYGTGTIDQALLAVLRVRHFFVRLFGLSGKLIVLDEVHAYDAYMSEEIYNLIGWASRCGASIILLSATLPANKRTRLIRAFQPSIEPPTMLEYPCVFGADLGGKTSWKPVSMKNESLEIYPVVVEKQDKIGLMANKLTDTVGEKGCVACILNTVAEAQELYDLLKDQFPDDELILFHSRFTLERRLEIETEIIRKYGKNGDRPIRGVVVASPVLQESLDVCFDAMLTEIAPFDLLLQRAGRLHRHKNSRPPHLQARQLKVFLPDLRKGNPDFGWSKFIYFPYLLDRSGSLFIKGDEYCPLSVKMPEGVSTLIESVYGETESPSMDKIREKWLEELEGAEFASIYHARTAGIATVHDKGDDPDYLGFLQNSNEDEAMPATRIGRPRITLVILEMGEDIAISTRKDERRLYRKSISTDNPRLVKHFTSIEPPVEWRESPLLRYCWPVFFEPGAAVNAGDINLAYDRLKGLSILRKKETRE